MALTNKKRLYLLLSLILVCVLVLSFSYYLLVNQNSNKIVNEKSYSANVSKANEVVQENSSEKGFFNKIKGKLVRVSNSITSNAISSTIVSPESFTQLTSAPSNEQDACYVDIQILENFSSFTNVTSFSLSNLKNLYGQYKWEVYDASNYSGDYNLTLLDNSNNSIGKYSLISSRFIIIDSLSNVSSANGSIVELNSSIIDSIIPYNAQIKNIIVENNGNITNLKINPSQISCTRDCRNQNEYGVYGKDKCCSNLIKNPVDDLSFVCSNCGDGICSSHESFYTCQEDCARVWPPVVNDSIITECKDIYSPGSYTLSTDIFSSGKCININANNVILDCNGHNITYGISLASLGISVQDHNNFTLKNCNFIEGSDNWNNIAIGLGNSSNDKIQNNNINVLNWGIIMKDSSFNIINNNNISGKSNAWNIFVDSGSTYNNITNNIINSLGPGATSAIAFYGDYYGNTRNPFNLVQNNVIYVHGYNSNGVLIAMHADNEAIVNNLFYIYQVSSKGIGEFQNSGLTDSNNNVTHLQ